MALRFSFPRLVPFAWPKIGSPILVVFVIGLVIVGYDLWLVLAHRDSFTITLEHPQSGEQVRCAVDLPHGQRPFEIFQMCVESCKAAGFMPAPGEKKIGAVRFSETGLASLQRRRRDYIPEPCRPVED
jgi:hypothetical protein